MRGRESVLLTVIALTKCAETTVRVDQGGQHRHRKARGRSLEREPLASPTPSRVSLHGSR